MTTNSVTFFANHKIEPIPKNSDLILAVWEIGTPANIGRVIRLGHNIGAKKVLFINENKTFRESKIKKTAGFSYDQMNWKFISKTNFFELLESEFQLIVLETCDGAKNIFEMEFPNKTILLAGSESHGIPSEIIEKNSIQVFIPMAGGCKSMNISHALSVAAFEWYRQKTVNTFNIL